MSEQKVVRRTVRATGRVLRKAVSWTGRYGWWFTGPLMYSAFLCGIVVTESIYTARKKHKQ